MARLLIPLALAALLYFAWGAIARLPSGRRRRLVRSLLWIGAAALIVLAVAGRIPWPVAAAPPLAVVLRWAGRLLSALPLIARLLSALRGSPGARPGRGNHGGGHGGPPPPGSRPSSSKMSRQQALSVLGLAEGASDADVIAAHRRLMQKLHPDTGGSDYLAAEINQARDVLLGRR